MSYTLRTGRDEFNNGQTNARPPGVGRNTLEGPGYATLDLRWSRAFELGASGRDERPEISIGVDAFNVTNHVNFNTPVGNQSSPLFGRSISSRPPRRIQLSASVTFDTSTDGIGPRPVGLPIFGVTHRPPSDWSDLSVFGCDTVEGVFQDLWRGLLVRCGEDANDDVIETTGFRARTR
jgi:hypothetical protein